jgi:hypothetical protein
MAKHLVRGRAPHEVVTQPGVVPVDGALGALG